MSAGSLLEGGLGRVRKAGPTERVYKDESVYSFDTPETETGLFICLNTFWGVGRDEVEAYSRRTGNTLFLYSRRLKTKVGKTEGVEEGPEKKITRLAIGVEGGFDGTEIPLFHVHETWELAVVPGFHMLPLRADTVGEQVIQAVEAIQTAESATKLAELEALSGTWDGEVRQMSRFAESLVQLENGKKIPPAGWVCEVVGCSMRDNLWLNLTDGAVLCGRRYFDGTGGNNHAQEHYAAMKLEIGADRGSEYPLAVKLGTITPDGRGDVYSYAEDDMVTDPHLVTHLRHFGINVAVLEKTDKSMVEMEIELNQRTGEWSSICESGRELKPLHGPGYTGLVNLGNSCYLNSVMQLLFALQPFVKRFETRKYFESAADPVTDLNVQMSKLCLGLLSGKYSGESAEGLSPHMFRSLVGKGHAEFGTKKQQDAVEFFLHLVNMLDRTSRLEGNPAECFKFQVEDKVVCDVTGMMRYVNRMEYVLPLPIPLEAATNLREVAAYEMEKAEQQARGAKLPSTVVRPSIPVGALLQAFAQREEVDKFYSTGAGRVCTGSRYTRLSTFPDYLVVQLKKFTLGPDWTPKKLDVSVDMPFSLDLSSLRGHGPQPNDTLLPDTDQKKEPSLDESVVGQLTEMGFHPNAARRAVVQSGNLGSEAATNWIMQHMDDPDLNEPMEPESGPVQPFLPDAAALESIQGMGFTMEQAAKALKATDNQVERAVDWIFSHMEELEDVQPNAPNQPPRPECTDGPGQYELVGFVSHMGTSTSVGHYVCHIRKEGKWVLFNDQKVAESENLPKDLGYLYFYQRQ